MKALQISPERRYLRGCVAIFAIVWMIGTCLPVLAGAGGLVATLTSGGDLTELAFPSIIAIVFTIPFFLVGLGLLVWSLWPIVVGMKVTRPEVYASSDAVRPGDSFSFSFRQTFKSAAEMKGATVQLVRRESATYRRGTDTYTVTDEVVAQQF